MKKRPVQAPRCIVIAGPNGAGKTTFAREFLPTGAGVVHFVNADLIAVGLAPLRPDVPKADVIRRFRRSRENFDSLYRPLADAWTIYDNAGNQPELLDKGP